MTSHSPTRRTNFYSLFISCVLIFFALRIVELVMDHAMHGKLEKLGLTILISFVNDISYLFVTGIVLYGIYFLISRWNKRTAIIICLTLAVVFILLQLILSQYYLISMVPLRSDLWGYSAKDVEHILEVSSGVSHSMILLIILVVGIVVWLFLYLSKRTNISAKYIFIIFFFFLIVSCIKFFYTDQNLPIKNEYSNNLSLNKSQVFLSSVIKYSLGSNAVIDSTELANSRKYFKDVIQPDYVDEKEYPFLRKNNDKDVLSPLLHKADTLPNIVMVIVEGLGRPFSGTDAYFESFTPFLDSIANHSLYWKNFLSTSGRTFAVLPSLLGSVPFGKNGFNELRDRMPAHFSLLNVLRSNGYHTSFFYGGNADFDDMRNYLEKSGIDSIYDVNDFPAHYQKMPGLNTEASWGYGDKELFRRYLETNSDSSRPRLDVLLTVSTHIPYRLNEQEKYLQLFENRMTQLQLSEQQKQKIRYFKYQFASILYVDDALNYLINEYGKRSNARKTIFIITGDHCLSELPLKSKLDIYHAPFIIYSPLIKQPAGFSSISSHFDVTPSLVQWLKNSYGLTCPDMTQWMGTGLDTAQGFRNIHAYPLMQAKNQLEHYVMSRYMIDDDHLFEMDEKMQLKLVRDKNIYKAVRMGFNRFKQKNMVLQQGARLIPDTVAIKF